MLEAMQNEENAFVTLTYSDGELPWLKLGSKDFSGLRATLEPRHLQLFLKRLRRVIAPLKVRFFGVGEYGEDGDRREVWNPHYHVALFGFPRCSYGDSRWSARQPCRCASCVVVERCWNRGFVGLGAIEMKSAQYIAGYTVKKMTGADDARLGGRVPEFARMSLRPGIGAIGLAAVASACGVGGYVQRAGDVPAQLDHGGRGLPLGRYLRRKLREECGLDAAAPAATIEAAAAQLQDLRTAATVVEVSASGRRIERRNDKLFARLIVEQGAQKVRQIEARLKIYERVKG